MSLVFPSIALLRLILSTAIETRFITFSSTARPVVPAPLVLLRVLLVED